MPVVLGIPLWLFILLLLLIIGLIVFAIVYVVHKISSSPNAAVAYMSGAQVASNTQSGTPGHELITKYAAENPQKSISRHRPADIYKDKDVDQTFTDGPAMVHLFVEDQNANIGMRNVHALKRGNTYTVGGGNSDFLIFLVPVPDHIGEIHFDGSMCTFVPRKLKYFPDMGNTQIRGCLEKTIHVVSDKGYDLYFRLERYINPLKPLNELLNSIKY
jgi:hypothetical protein